jgi:hypothetical protein
MHRSVLYRIMKKFSPPLADNKLYLWLYLIRDAFILYGGCFIIELVRSVIFNFSIFNRRYYERFCNWIDSLFEDRTNEDNDQQEIMTTFDCDTVDSEEPLIQRSESTSEIQIDTQSIIDMMENQ